jgi:hypothetical protein
LKPDETAIEAEIEDPAKSCDEESAVKTLASTAFYRAAQEEIACGGLMRARWSRTADESAGYL